MENIMIKEHFEHKDLKVMTDNQKYDFILELFSAVNLSIDEDISKYSDLKKAIRGSVVLSKNQNFIFSYGEIAFLYSGSMYSYFYDENNENDDYSVHCLLNKNLYGNMYVPIIPNNSYIPALLNDADFEQFKKISKDRNNVWEVCAKASTENTKLIICDLKGFISNHYIQDVLNRYFLEFPNIDHPINIRNEIINERSILPLYRAFKDIGDNFRYKILRNFLKIPKTTWNSYRSNDINNGLKEHKDYKEKIEQEEI